MNRKPLTALLAVMAGLYSGMPALADQAPASTPALSQAAGSDPTLRGPLEGARPQTPAPQPAAASKPAAASGSATVTAEETGTTSKDKQGVLAGIAGAAVEAPAAICRQSARELDAGVNDLTNNSNSPLLRAPAALITLPFSLVAGCVQGVVYALRYNHDDSGAPANLRKVGAEP